MENPTYIYVDSNNRIKYSDDLYTPQYSPYLFRTRMMRALIGGGWSNWHAHEVLVDTLGQSHTVDVSVKYDTKEEAENWIEQNKF